MDPVCSCLSKKLLRSLDEFNVVVADARESHTIK